jgi:hypothetical protein
VIDLVIDVIEAIARDKGLPGKIMRYFASGLFLGICTFKIPPHIPNSLPTFAHMLIVLLLSFVMGFLLLAIYKRFKKLNDFTYRPHIYAWYSFFLPFLTMRGVLNAA